MGEKPHKAFAGREVGFGGKIVDFGFRYSFTNQNTAVVPHAWWKVEVRGNCVCRGGAGSESRWTDLTEHMEGRRAGYGSGSP